MKITVTNKNRIIKEIKFAIKQMKDEKDPKAKLYYFSAIYGIMPRIFNIEFIPDLVFAHVVLSSTYNHINSRLENSDKVIKIPDNLYDRLIEITEEMLNAIERNESLYEALTKFTLLGYVTTGNGYYLYQKGLLKI